MYKVDTYFYESVDKYAKEEYTNTVVKIEYRGVEQLAARRAHNPKVDSSSLSPATTNFIRVARDCDSLIFLLKIYFYKSGDNLGTVHTFLCNK